MTIKIKELDDETKDAVKSIEELEPVSRDQEITILISRNILLKLVNQSSIYETNSMIQKLINTKDLALRINSGKIKRLVELNGLIIQGLKEYKNLNRLYDYRRFVEIYDRDKKRLQKDIDDIQKIKEQAEQLSDDRNVKRSEAQIQELNKLVKSMNERIETIKKEYYGRLSSHISKIRAYCDEIHKIEKEFDVLLCNSNIYSFCLNCLNILKEGTIDTNINCEFYKSEITSGEVKIFNYLNSELEAYLHGKWLENYIARLLSKKGWRIWVGSLVLGSSGINHEVDILAIKNGYVMICECKTGNIARKDVFNFSTKNHDIKSNYAFWFSLEKLPDRESEDYMKKTPELMHLDNLQESTEDKILNELEKIDVS